MHASAGEREKTFLNHSSIVAATKAYFPAKLMQQQRRTSSDKVGENEEKKKIYEN